MIDDAEPPSDDGFAAVLAEYLTRLDRGEAVCREAFLREHPEHAAALRDYFSDVEVVTRLHPTFPKGPEPTSHGPLGEFGEYELLNVIGRGGTGIVYRARKRATDEVVALKMLLHGLLLTAIDVQRFRNETATTAQLIHPGIVPIYEVGEFEGHLFYTMPLFTGGNLARRVIAGPMPARAAAEMCLAVADAIDFAHRHGVIHRDLKPANVLLDEQSSPHIGDFGLARPVAAGTRDLTRTGELLGTPNYMAPEQVMGDRSRVGPAADIYALGAVLYALLVGRPPFHSKLITETLQKICSADPVPPRDLNHQVPPALETICLKCLEKSPADRYRSAAELMADLRRFLAGKQPVARRTSGLELARRWFVRNPVIGMLVVGICLILVAGTAFSLYYAKRARQREQVAQTNLYAADMNLAQQHLRSGAVGSALQLLERHRPPTDGKSPPPWEWNYLWNQCHGELRQFEGPKSAVYAAAFSPDGRTVAAAGADRAVWLWETASGKVKLKLTDHTATIRGIAFSPDGQKLVTVADDGMAIVWHTATGKRLASLVGSGSSLVDSNSDNRRPSVGTIPSDNPLTTVDFSPDGRLIATGGNGARAVNLWDAETYAFKQSLDVGPIESVAFAPSGAQLALAARDGCIYICRPNERQLWVTAKTIRAHSHTILDIAWNSDGTHMVSAGADRLIKLWDTANLSELTTFGPFKESVYCIRFSPSGRRVIASVRNAPLMSWDIDRPDDVTKLTGHNGLVPGIAYDPQGWRIVSAGEDGTVRLWDPAKSTEHDRLEGHAGGVRSVAFSPNGKMLASGGYNDGAIILWNSKTLQPLRVLRSSPRCISGLEFSPESARLASADINRPELRVWDVGTGRSLLAAQWNAEELVDVAWRPDGKTIAVLDASGVVEVLDAIDGRILSKWSAHNRSHGGVDLRPNGNVLATTGFDQTVRLWNASTHKRMAELQGHAAPTTNVAFDRSGKWLASSSSDHTVRLWDTATGRHVRTLTGHSGTTYGVDFSPDTTRIVSASTDQTVKVWDVTSGLELQTLSGHTNWVHDVAFSPDGQDIVSAGYDGTVRVWHAPIVSPPRSGEGLGEGHSADSAVIREASALVNYLFVELPDRESVTTAIKGNTTISDAVRAAALDQAKSQLPYWPAILAGHHATERHDWAAAAAAYERVTALAPDDPTHWYWLAMAALAANRMELYHRACDELLHRYVTDESKSNLYPALRVWLVAPHDPARFAKLHQHVDAQLQQYPLSDPNGWLYKLRGRLPAAQFHNLPEPPAVLGMNADEWYILALVWLKKGDNTQAAVAYRNGLHQERIWRTSLPWHENVFNDALRAEVESLIGESQLQPSGPGRNVSGGDSSTSVAPADADNGPVAPSISPR